MLIDQRLADAALEAVELRLDDAEANLSEALHCGDPRRRDAVSMFMLRNVQRAAKRGYSVAASAASLEININTPPKHYTVVWGKPDEPDRELGPGEFRRDGRILSTPDYGGDDTDADQHDGCCRGRACPPSAPMIAHEATAIEEPEPRRRRGDRSRSPPPPSSQSPPPPVMSVSGSPLWVRASACRPIRMDRCLAALPAALQCWPAGAQDAANDAVRVRATPRATPNGEMLSGKRRRGRRCGLEG